MWLKYIFNLRIGLQENYFLETIQNICIPKSTRITKMMITKIRIYENFKIKVFRINAKNFSSFFWNANLLKTAFFISMLLIKFTTKYTIFLVDIKLDS